MNLPLILDIALGLIFIYLSLSLLAAEIQEMISTVFQWRAQHLRKSIEILLGGDAGNSEEAEVIQLANSIYNNPLIKSLNQEAKGFLARLPRRLTWLFAKMYRFFKKPRPGMNQNDTFFGEQQYSAPSYIPSESFASSLIDTLHLPDLVQNLIESRLKTFKDKNLADIRQILDKLSEEINQENHFDEEFTIFLNNANREFIQLQTEFEQAIFNFEHNQATLNSTINYLASSVDKYIENLKLNRGSSELSNIAIFRLTSLRKDMFDDVERTILLAGLRPNLDEVVQLINTSSNVYQEVSSFLREKDSDTHQNLQNFIQKLPPSLSHNLTVLAKGVQTKVIDTEEGIFALRRRLENSFDRSMERASGVYKRNSKGVALLIGLILAFGMNADAFHMLNRLSKDSVLRQTVTENVANVVINNDAQTTSSFTTSNSQNIQRKLRDIKKSTEIAIDDISLPVGWTYTNLEKQLKWETGTETETEPEPKLKIMNLDTRENSTSDKLNLFQRIINWAFDGENIPGKILNLMIIFVGWIVSGIAISMGAPFWFDLISRIVNVRNTGRIPK